MNNQNVAIVEIPRNRHIGNIQITENDYAVIGPKLDLMDELGMPMAVLSEGQYIGWFNTQPYELRVPKQDIEKVENKTILSYMQLNDGGIILVLK